MNRCKRRLWDASKSELTTNSGLVTLSSKKIQKLNTEPAKSCYTSAIGNSGQEFSVTDSSTVQSNDSRLYSSEDSIVKRPALPSSVYNVNCEHLARLLLGKCIVRELENGTHACGKIVETESYPGSTDMASHSYKGKTLRNAAMFMDPGTAYVYNIYGMYQCFNISSKVLPF
ncbi:PREDICTED: putative 3-methyladenine DNA glycosylase isoform X2 [Priapulus caudatus]|uniref:DNA-3-methyladenine glycosylase II n=1 Tax=Priapulus caudatus TaxID=37621 RepID=A0ABM1EJK8_PRICU|nr:PREDICTED: putative 3-methyladenine DNA glycosylase isoform X2 [Priapulus caudatus]